MGGLLAMLEKQPEKETDRGHGVIRAYGGGRWSELVKVRVIAALPAGRCGLAETARVVRYLALESAGQCGPCLNGLPRIAAALAEIAGGRARPQAIADVERWSGLVTGRGACHHPDGTTRFVRSALRTFAAEVDRHQRGRCSAGVTRPFLPVPKDAARTEHDWI